MHKSAGFLYGLDLHHLDHLAPFCNLMKIPLIFTNGIAFSMAKEFYPGIKIKLYSPLTFSEEILINYDVIFTCLPKELIDPLFFFDEHKLRKKILSIWIPHGNSDKDNLAGLKNEKIILAYGKQMIDIMTKKEVLSKVFQSIIIGNYRAHFFEDKKKLSLGVLKKKLTFLNKQKTVLYAPTWNDSPVEEHLHYILKNLPSNINLFVKLHPNTLTKNFHSRFKELYEEKPNIKFIDNVPTIFPILDKTDILITDISSIAYDFLYFDKPIFFLSRAKSPIHLTGRLTSIETLFEDIRNKDTKTEARKALYNYAFSHQVHFESLTSIIKNTYETYFENELHFL